MIIELCDKGKGSNTIRVLAREAKSLLDDKSGQVIGSATDRIANALEDIQSAVEKIEERTRLGGNLDVMNALRMHARITEPRGTL